MPLLTIIRGLPGSGKSTIAQSLVHTGDLDISWWEADMFFTNDYTGEYAFNVDLISQAHRWCYHNVLKSLRNGSDVVVSNTFTQVWEMQRYFDLVELIPGTVIKVIEVKTQFKSIHDVPESKIETMQKRWQEIPEHMNIPIEVIS